MNLRTLFILLTILIFNQFSFAQKIEPGKYISVWKYNHFTGETVYNSEYGEEITILDSLNFKFRYRDDITDRRGTGIYKTGKKFLNLEFDGNTAGFDTSNYKIIHSEISQTDSVMLSIKVQDKFIALYGARIEILKSGNTLLKSYTNEDGAALITIPKTSLPVSIKISYVGYDKTYINVESAKNLNIVVTMDWPYKIITEKKSVTYSIKEVDLNGFYARGGSFSDWTFFKREE
ncbi:MAG TPA: hypothetical protein PKE39_13060 [Ignavibacteria bacterium]|nr:hypothetical protein [Ignavibacteria bacterium]HMQ99949.1 hypothetical protein [Ignavibacteria bacterium]